MMYRWIQLGGDTVVNKRKGIRDMNELKAMILNERKIIIIKNNINKKWLATNG